MLRTSGCAYLNFFCYHTNFLENQAQFSAETCRNTYLDKYVRALPMIRKLAVLATGAIFRRSTKWHILYAAPSTNVIMDRKKDGVKRGGITVYT